MRKIIRKKVYDTETARRVGSEWDNGYSVSDFGYCAEQLYRKKTGEYFLHGEGGAQSKYARSCGRTAWCGGEAIIPLTYEAAREWAEEHLETEEYEAEFGTPDEDERYDLHTKISMAAWQTMSRAASAEGITVAAVIERMAATLDGSAGGDAR